MYKSGDILELLLARILESVVDRAMRIFLHAPGHAYPANVRQCLNACCNVHPVPMDADTVDDDVTDVDPHSERDPPLRRHPRIPLDHSSLDFDCATQCLHHARK
jgi:hypothetical protein